MSLLELPAVTLRERINSGDASALGAVDEVFARAEAVGAGRDGLNIFLGFDREWSRAQADIDLRPELYTKHYKKEFPKRFHDRMDTRRWGPGERIVFEPYSREIFEDSRAWIAERGIFDGGDLGGKAYDNAVIRLAS